MCKWGTTTDVEVTISADLSHTGKEFVKLAKIDSCIAQIVKALEQGGIRMRASCCGHGKGPGSITLEDGRVLLIYRPEKENEKCQNVNLTQR